MIDDHGAPAHRCEVGRVLKHDPAGLAAEFEEQALEARAAFFHDVPADGRGAGEADQIDSRVGDQHLTCGCRIAGGNHVEHAGRKARFLGDLAEDEVHARGVRRTLQYDRAAGEEGRTQLAQIDVERDVPRRDRRHDARRLVDHDAAGS
jgi:hypothetical protein